MGQSVVSVMGVFKEFYRGDIHIPVLQGIDLEVLQGDYYALMGPSGSGKTTLLNLIAGLDTVTEGSIQVAEEEITDKSEDELARWRSENIGFIFQLYNLIPVLTAFENVELPLFLRNLGKRDRAERVTTALEIVGLGDRMDHFPRQLSGGQEQRVSIARALVSDPTLLVADEPTGDLGRKSGIEILDLIQKLNEDFKKTVIMVTHDPQAAERAGHQVFLEEGKLVSSLTEI